MGERAEKSPILPPCHLQMVRGLARRIRPQNCGTFLVQQGEGRREREKQTTPGQWGVRHRAAHVEAEKN